jgi:hypothetical protein
MQTPVCQTGIRICAKTFGVTLISDRTVARLLFFTYICHPVSASLGATRQFSLIS